MALHSKIILGLLIGLVFGIISVFIGLNDFVSDWIDNGASVIGGCCRTTTDHIKEIRKIVDRIKL